MSPADQQLLNALQQQQPLHAGLGLAPTPVYSRAPGTAEDSGPLLETELLSATPAFLPPQHAPPLRHRQRAFEYSSLSTGSNMVNVPAHRMDIPDTVRWHDFSALPIRYQMDFQRLRALALAHDMEDHWDTYKVLDYDVHYDTSPIILDGRERVRILSYFLKWLAYADVKPIMARYVEKDAKRAVVEMYVESLVSPHRPWWLPLTWLLPKTFDMQATVKLVISKGYAEDGSEDVISCLRGRLHNWPTLPSLVRYANGLFFGTLGALTEPIWGSFVSIFGDKSYHNRREHHFTVGSAAANAAYGAYDYSAYKTKQLGEGAYNTAAAVPGVVADTTAKTYGVAANTTASAYNTLSSVPAAVAHTAGEVLSATAVKAAGVYNSVVQPTAVVDKAGEVYDATKANRSSTYNNGSSNYNNTSAGTYTNTATPVTYTKETATVYGR